MKRCGLKACRIHNAFKVLLLDRLWTSKQVLNQFKCISLIVSPKLYQYLIETIFYLIIQEKLFCMKDIETWLIKHDFTFCFSFIERPNDFGTSKSFELIAKFLVEPRVRLEKKCTEIKSITSKCSYLPVNKTLKVRY